VRTATRLGGFTPIGLPQNTDNLFDAVRFAFHEHFSISFKKYSPIFWVNYLKSPQAVMQVATGSHPAALDHS